MTQQQMVRPTRRSSIRGCAALAASMLVATACISGSGETDAGAEIDDVPQAVSAAADSDLESSTGADQARGTASDAALGDQPATTLTKTPGSTEDQPNNGEDGTTTDQTGAGAGTSAPADGSDPEETNDPSTTAEATPTTIEATTVAPVTEAPPTAGGGSDGDYFATLPPGSTLPSGEACAARVKSRPEIRPTNATANSARGTTSNGRYPRVDGNFVGTTDEIIQWAACKWGMDEDWARAQVAMESWWDQDAGGDRTSDQSECHPSLRTNSGDCPESVGLMQVRFLYHSEAFVDANAIRSSAYNLDYGFASWRDCYEGNLGYLNDTERGATYAAGDLEGCLGTWFSGRWYVDRARTYIDEVRQLRDSRIWEQARFQS